MRTATVRSFSVAAFMLARGYQVLGAEVVDGGGVVYRFSAADVDAGMRGYVAVKKTLDDLANAVRGGQR
jgi:hypothetical protein